jgi:hypothetical protein
MLDDRNHLLITIHPDHRGDLQSPGAHTDRSDDVVNSPSLGGRLDFEPTSDHPDHRPNEAHMPNLNVVLRGPPQPSINVDNERLV